MRVLVLRCQYFCLTDLIRSCKTIYITKKITNMTTHTTGEHDYRSNWLEANKLAIYKSSREAELGTPKNNPVSKLYKARIELGFSGLQAQHSNYSVTLRPLLKFSIKQIT